ncbi:phospholipase D-like domain-containing protein [Cryomorphaceae bacterium 1068]|nr:phospholipase D-like domain-containing protein [Cryomorphaceae bacterium 1068]
MSDSIDSLIDILRDSLMDVSMTRAEKRSLREALSSASLNTNDRIKLMSEVKGLAHGQTDSAEVKNLISWMYGAFQTIAKDNERKVWNSAFFSPGEECRDKIVNSLKSATHNIDICVFTISDDRISETIMERHNLRVPVRIISDNDKAFDRGSDLFELREKGIEIRFDPGPVHMHHKFALMDDVLITGSYNWTRSAAHKNYENIVVSNESGLVKEFAKEFDRLWLKFR